jgi:hypothetical protein
MGYHPVWLRPDNRCFGYMINDWEASERFFNSFSHDTKKSFLGPRLTVLLSFRPCGNPTASESGSCCSELMGSITVSPQTRAMDWHSRTSCSRSSWSTQPKLWWFWPPAFGWLDGSWPIQNNGNTAHSLNKVLIKFNQFTILFNHCYL